MFPQNKNNGVFDSPEGGCGVLVNNSPAPLRVESFSVVRGEGVSVESGCGGEIFAPGSWGVDLNLIEGLVPPCQPGTTVLQPKQGPPRQACVFYVHREAGHDAGTATVGARVSVVDCGAHEVRPCEGMWTRVYGFMSSQPTGTSEGQSEGQTSEGQTTDGQTTEGQTSEGQTSEGQTTEGQSEGQTTDGTGEVGGGEIGGGEIAGTETTGSQTEGTGTDDAMDTGTP
ncbi:hypothetical protein OG828_36965 [Streptomyces sp. NBC_00457]|uniref:hypothetical protein n=1 Tax=Streptomyces sp. NBC_00457 TaxID=2975748 RepID=UPI002E1DDE75